MNVTGRTIQLGVIGNPIEHTVSPQLHNTMAERMALDYIYSPFNVKKGDVKNAMEGMRALSIRGLNVTVPHKKEAAAFCDEIDPFAKKMGACNTLVNTDGVIKGYNTDGPGFIKSLAREGVSVEGKRVVVIGAGGAAAGVAMAVADSGAESVGIINRTKMRAVELCDRINRYYKGVAVARDDAMGAQILINTTNVGMNSDETPFSDFDALEKDCVVCDIVYCPRETRLLRDAAEKGFKTVGGIGMLINQAVIAFELFTEKAVDEKTVDYLYKMTSLDKTIVLTGFMGTGKSAVGRRLCNLTGAEFIDTDYVIEKNEGMKIPEIFEKYGEGYFRDRESEVIKSLAGRKGAVVSLGGGAVIRKENIDVLREKGIVFCLNADIERVYRNIGGNTESRPLLSGKTMEEAKALLESRKEYYANCDYAIDVTMLEKEQTADKILEIYMNQI